MFQKIAETGTDAQEFLRILRGIRKGGSAFLIPDSCCVRERGNQARTRHGALSGSSGRRIPSRALAAILRLTGFALFCAWPAWIAGGEGMTGRNPETEIGEEHEGVRSLPARTKAGAVIARYGGGAVTLEEAKKEILGGGGEAPRIDIVRYWTPPRDERTAAKSIAARESLVESARERGLDREEAYLRLKDRERTELLAHRYRRATLESVTSYEAKNYYAAHIDQFMNAGLDVYRNIFIQYESQDPGAREKARGKAEKALEAIRSGEDFADVERRFSTRREEEMDREYRMTGDAKVFPPVREALEGLEPGEVSGIVEARHGLMILKLVEHMPAGARDFEEVEPFCRGRVQIERNRGEVRDEVDRRGIEIHPERLFSLERSPRDVVAMGEGFVLRAEDVPGRPPSLSGEPNEKEKKQMVHRVLQAVETRLLAEKAEAAGMASEPEFRKQMEAFEDRALVLLELDRRIEEGLAASPVTEKELREQYEKHRDAYMSKEMTRIRVIHIPVEYEEGAPPDKVHFAREKAREKSEEILDLIRNGADFADLAREYSTGFNAEDGGLFPYEIYGPRGHVIDLAVEPMEVGEVAGPLEEENGYFIVKLEGRKEPAILSFEDAQDIVRDDLLFEKAAKIQNEILDEVCRSVGFTPVEAKGGEVTGDQ